MMNTERTHAAASTQLLGFPDILYYSKPPEPSSAIFQLLQTESRFSYRNDRRYMMMASSLSHMTQIASSVKSRLLGMDERT